MDAISSRKNSQLSSHDLKKILGLSGALDLNLGIFSIIAAINSVNLDGTVFNLNKFLTVLREYHFLERVFCEDRTVPNTRHVYPNELTKAEKILLDGTQTPINKLTGPRAEPIFNSIKNKGYLHSYEYMKNPGRYYIKKNTANTEKFFSEFKQKIYPPKKWCDDLYPSNFSDKKTNDLIVRLRLTNRFYQYLHNQNLACEYDNNEKQVNSPPYLNPTKYDGFYNNVFNLPLLGICGDQNNPILYIFSIFEDTSNRSFEHINVDMDNIITSACTQDKTIRDLLITTKENLDCDSDPFYYSTRLLARSIKSPEILMVVNCISFSKITNSFRTNAKYPLQQLYRSIEDEKTWFAYYPKRSYHRFKLLENDIDNS